MKTIFHTLGLLLLGAGLSAGISSCKQDYEDVDGATKKGYYDTQRQVYFPLQSGTNTLPVANFAYGEATYTAYGQYVNSGELSNDSTRIRVDVPVRMTGLAAGDSLEFSLVVGEPIDYTTIYANEADRPKAAVSGVDYEPLRSSYKIPADSFATVIPIYFNRSEVAKAEAAGKELILELRPNANFGAKFTEADTYRIRIIDDLTEPAWWTNFYGPYGILGTYSKEKHRIILGYFDKAFWDALGQGDNMYSPIYYARIARVALQLRTQYPDLGFGEKAQNYVP